MVLSYDYEDALSATTSEIDKKFWDYFDVSTTVSYVNANSTLEVQDTLPRDQAAVLATYGVLLAIGGLSNIVVLVSLARTRRRKSRIDLLMTHLVLADVCVTCVVIPLESSKLTNKSSWLSCHNTLRIVKMSSQDDSLRVVIDVGSHSTKVGFGYESSPRSVIYTTVGRFRQTGLHDGIPLICCGEEAIKRQGLLNLVWPMQNGLITNWDEMEKLWHHIYYKELSVPPEESRLMHTEHAFMPKKDKEKMAEIMFETFTVQGLYIVRTSVAALYASGRVTGVVWENGSACSCVTPIFEGFHQEHAAMCSPITGDFLTNLLERMVEKIGYSFRTPRYRTILENIKAEMCYVAQDYVAEMELSASSGGIIERYNLPDGQQVILGDERFQCPECIFRPSLEGLDCPGLVELVMSSISKCDVDCRALFYNNLVPAGGSSMFRGIVSRLSRDLKMRLPGMNVHVDDIPTKQFAQWRGASIFASLDNLKGFWMTRKEYNDLGPDAVNYKFF